MSRWSDRSSNDTRRATGPSPASTIPMFLTVHLTRLSRMRWRVRAAVSTAIAGRTGMTPFRMASHDFARFAVRHGSIGSAAARRQDKRGQAPSVGKASRNQCAPRGRKFSACRFLSKGPEIQSPQRHWVTGKPAGTTFARRRAHFGYSYSERARS